MIDHNRTAVFRFVVSFRNEKDPRSIGYLQDAQALGFSFITEIQCQDLFFIEGHIDSEDHDPKAHTQLDLESKSLGSKDLERLATEVFSDPILQNVKWDRLLKTGDKRINTEHEENFIEVTLRPGVTDPVATQIVRVAKMLGIKGVEQACTGKRFIVKGQNLNERKLHELAQRLLANPTIQHYQLGEIEPSFPEKTASSGKVEMIPVADMTDDELLNLSNQRRASLDLAEMKKIKKYFREKNRHATDVEFEMIAQTWSEHCVHKTFKAEISYTTNGKTEKINGLLKTFLRSATEEISAPWVRSAFVDNAGIIDFDGENEISFKAETHNHPSAIEPFGGANTGIGGVIRDILGVSAKPIAATDVLCFGPKNMKLTDLPDGVLHPRRISSGVVAGIQDYGNKIGIPTVNGAVLYDDGFTANPLVYCGCVGIAPLNTHKSIASDGDHVIIIGGQTGRDGLRGATFSSMTMDAQTGEVSGASVQIGDPITEKGLIEVTTRARDEGLYSAITDCGAGGLSSAVGEMSSTCGADVDLASVKLKYPGLDPWEIWLSEAQERMVMAVPQEKLGRLEKICQIFDVELTDIGTFNNSETLIVRYQDKEVLNLANEFLHEGIPQRKLFAEQPTAEIQEDQINFPLSPDFCEETLLRLLSHPNIASKEKIIHGYDHEVQGGTVVKPLVGIKKDGPSDAAVLKPIETKTRMGISLANGINPEYGKVDPYNMAVSVIDEAIRNAVSVGTDPSRIALLDNFCWGDPSNPKTLGTLVEACKGCYDAALHFRTPFISGKDSLNNEYFGNDGKKHAIPPSLLISTIGTLDDVQNSVTMDLKAENSIIYILGKNQGCFGGSHFKLVNPELSRKLNNRVPALENHASRLYQTVYQAIKKGLITSCHDLSEGGLAVSLAEMCIAGRMGISLSLGGENPLAELFGESNTCLLLEIKPEHQKDLEVLLTDLPYQRIGCVTSQQTLKISVNEQLLINLKVEDLLNHWQL